MRTETATQRDGAARGPALTAPGRPPGRTVAAAVATRAEQADATHRQAPRAAEAAAQGRAGQVTRAVTWRHCMATMQPVERPAPQLGGLEPAVPTVVPAAGQAEQAPMVQLHSVATARVAQAARVPVVAAQVPAERVAPLVTAPAPDRTDMERVAMGPRAPGEPAEAAMPWLVNPAAGPAGETHAARASVCLAQAAMIP